MVNIESVKAYIDKQLVAGRFKSGTIKQLEGFKSACIGTGDNNWDLMCDCLENIKSDIKDKMLAEEWGKELKLVEKIIDWYRKIEINPQFFRNTPDGKIFSPPYTLKYKINKNLRVGYETLVRVMRKMGMLG